MNSNQLKTSMGQGKDRIPGIYKYQSFVDISDKHGL